MSLNWREIAVVVSELPLEGSLIQRVNQIGFHTLVFELHHPDSGFWQLYTEFGTPTSRLHRLTGPARAYRKKKTKKLQRFIQFMRAHIEGARIVSVTQPARDRLLVLKTIHGGTTMHLIFRFYSGPGANVIVCDEQMVIRELLYRRPNRNEIASNLFEIPLQQPSEDDGRFPVRPYPTDMTFNAYIEQQYATDEEESVEQLVESVEALRDKRIDELKSQLEIAHYRTIKCADFESYRISGDVLSASTHLVKPRAAWVSVPDYTSKEADATATIALDPSLSVGENIAAYYKKYQKGKTAWEHARQEEKEIETRLQETEHYFERLLEIPKGSDIPDIDALRRVMHPQQSDEQSLPGKDPFADAPGLHFTSSIFTILVGRNAKENDTLLRRWARGNDWWLHTRDVPGGYVIIKTIPGKTIPLDTILDAGNLAVLFSKAKEARKADLYYTQVKHLKRPKGGKQGLVLPTQEKNLSIQLEDSRLQRLFPQSKTGVETWTK